MWCTHLFNSQCIYITTLTMSLLVISTKKKLAAHSQLYQRNNWWSTDCGIGINDNVFVSFHQRFYIVLWILLCHLVFLRNGISNFRTYFWAVFFTSSSFWDIFGRRKVKRNQKLLISSCRHFFSLEKGWRGFRKKKTMSWST